MVELERTLQQQDGVSRPRARFEQQGVAQKLQNVRHSQMTPNDCYSNQLHRRLNNEPAWVLTTGPCGLRILVPEPTDTRLSQTRKFQQPSCGGYRTPTTATTRVYRQNLATTHRQQDNEDFTRKLKILFR